MILVLAFAITLLSVVLLSRLAERSILSTNVLYLLAGFIIGPGLLGLVTFPADDPGIARVVELALFSVLFADGMRVRLRDLIGEWHLPGRALLLGMPLAIGGMTLLARFVVGLAWLESLLLGAVLSPTDPVFAAAMVGREEVPSRLRRFLNVESGLNDGLALPLVLILLGMARESPVPLAALLGELALGVLLGIALPWIVLRLEQSWVFRAASDYNRPLLVFAIGLLLLALATLVHANLFLAAFTAGITVATLRPDLRDDFQEFGELIAELLKSAALLLFGSLLSLAFFMEIPLTGYLFAFLAIVLMRPLSIELALIGSEITWREKIAAAWFGPRGFASVVFSLLVIGAGVPRAGDLFHLATLVIVASIVAHSSTDVVIARWLQHARHNPAAEG